MWHPETTPSLKISPKDFEAFPTPAATAPWYKAGGGCKFGVQKFRGRKLEKREILFLYWQKINGTILFEIKSATSATIRSQNIYLDVRGRCGSTSTHAKSRGRTWDCRRLRDGRSRLDDGKGRAGACKECDKEQRLQGDHGGLYLKSSFFRNVKRFWFVVSKEYDDQCRQILVASPFFPNWQITRKIPNRKSLPAKINFGWIFLIDIT